MIRTLLATTALAALMSTGAMAQDAAPATDPMAPATTEAPATTTDAPASTTTDAPVVDTNADDANDGAMGTTDDAMGMRQPFELSAGYAAVDTDNLVTELMGAPIYSSTGDDAEEIGTVSDLVFTENGEIAAVIVGVGGFLGIGEKAVAVDFAELEFTIAADNTERWVLPTTADALNAAPDFVWAEDEPADVDAMGTDGMTPADPAMAPADPAMAPADPAMAPAAPATN